LPAPESAAAGLARAFVALVIARAEALGLSHSDLARAAFPDAGDPAGRWRKVRNQGQHLTMADAWRLAKAVGEDVAALCWKAGREEPQPDLPV
jgi:hypothetical protein